MNIPHCLVAVLLAFLVSCEGRISEAMPAPDHNVGVTLKLNDGKKWKVNGPTHVGMGKMQEILTKFAASSAKDFRALGTDLQAETTRIIQKCNMTGEPHDQLHVVFNPMLEIIEKLVSGKGGAAEVGGFQKHLNDYDSHFES